MRVLHVRNVQEALPRALELLYRESVERPSRNGPVLLGPCVATVYEKPCERVVFHPQRDYNVFFTLYEALWILAGRKDITPLTRYVRTFGQFSDDGHTQHAAYGYRLRNQFGIDQLSVIARTLRENPDDRRCVAQIWDACLDLAVVSKDIPCNDTIIFQRNPSGALDMTVFCRSNDIVYGAYYANAFHFGFLLEYMAAAIECPVGTYTQISVNWHGYLNTLELVKDILPDRVGFIDNPYIDRRVHVTPLEGDIDRIDEEIAFLLNAADTEFVRDINKASEPWVVNAYHVLHAHHIWKTAAGADRFQRALDILAKGDERNDWIVSGREWLERRKMTWENKH